MELTYTSDWRLVAANCKQSVKYGSARWLRKDVLNMSFKQLSAWTCARLDPSVSDVKAGCRPISCNLIITSSKEGLSALDARIPTIMAGIPADLLVVEPWVYMQFSAPCVC